MTKAKSISISKAAEVAMPPAEDVQELFIGAEESKEEPKVFIKMTTGTFKARNYTVMSPGKLRMVATEVETDLVVPKGKALKTACIIGLTKEATANARLNIVGETIITQEGPVTLKINNAGNTAVHWKQGTVIGTYVFLEGDAK